MSSILYQATIKCSDSKYKQKRYKGICETTFKKRYANHKKSFNLIKSKNDTTLSIEYWNLKQKQQAPRPTWEIKGQYKTYNPTLKKCKVAGYSESMSDMFSSQGPGLRVLGFSVAGPMSKGPSSRVLGARVLCQGSRVPGPRVPSPRSQVSGPDFRLCRLISMLYFCFIHVFSYEKTITNLITIM